MQTKTQDKNMYKKDQTLKHNKLELTKNLKFEV